MYYDRTRRKSSPRRILLLLILVGIGVLLIANQNELRQTVIPPPTPTATRTARRTCFPSSAAGSVFRSTGSPYPSMWAAASRESSAASMWGSSMLRRAATS